MELIIRDEDWAPDKEDLKNLKNFCDKIFKHHSAEMMFSYDMKNQAIIIITIFE